MSQTQKKRLGARVMTPRMTRRRSTPHGKLCEVVVVVVGVVVVVVVVVDVVVCVDVPPVGDGVGVGVGVGLGEEGQVWGDTYSPLLYTVP